MKTKESIDKHAKLVLSQSGAKVSIVQVARSRLRRIVGGGVFFFVLENQVH